MVQTSSYEYVQEFKIAEKNLLVSIFFQRNEAKSVLESQCLSHNLVLSLRLALKCASLHNASTQHRIKVVVVGDLYVTFWMIVATSISPIPSEPLNYVTLT